MVKVVKFTEVNKIISVRDNEIRSFEMNDFHLQWEVLVDSEIFSLQMRFYVRIFEILNPTAE